MYHLLFYVSKILSSLQQILNMVLLSKTENLINLKIITPEEISREQQSAGRQG